MRKCKLKVGLAVASVALLTSCHSEIEMSVDNNSNKNSTYISIAEARADLMGILADTDSEATRGGKRGARRIAEEFTLSEKFETRSGESDSIGIYLFNFENEEGYALMSGDSRLPSLLVLAEAGSLNLNGENNVNGGLAGFYGELDGTIKDLTPLPTTPLPIAPTDYYTYGPWENIFHMNMAYCNVQWNQYGPYNNVIKESYSGKEVCTGCVTTSVAQIMSVFKFPPSYEGYTFEWDEMTRYKDASNCSPDARQQVADLFACLGQKKNLDVTYRTYEEGGSPAKTENIPHTLRAFGYSSGGTVKSYNSDELKSELLLGFPVSLSGYSYKEEVTFLGIHVNWNYRLGHEWLAHSLLERRREKTRHDPYGEILYTTTESVYYPLYNWGWGGKHNGYYLLNDFNSNKKGEFDENTRGQEEGNFQFNKRMVVGIRK